MPIFYDHYCLWLQKTHLGAWNSDSSVHNSFALQRYSQELVLILSVTDQYIYNPHHVLQEYRCCAASINLIINHLMIGYAYPVCDHTCMEISLSSNSFQKCTFMQIREEILIAHTICYQVVVVPNLDRCQVGIQDLCFSWGCSSFRINSEGSMSASSLLISHFWSTSVGRWQRWRFICHFPPSKSGLRRK